MKLNKFTKEAIKSPNSVFIECRVISALAEEAIKIRTLLEQASTLQEALDTGEDTEGCERIRINFEGMSGNFLGSHGLSFSNISSNGVAKAGMTAMLEALSDELNKSYEELSECMNSSIILKDE